MFRFITIFSLFLFSLNSLAQVETFASRSSLGLMVGGSYYIGDLNKYGHFRRTNLSGGIIYKFHINSRLELRGGARYGKIEAYDTDSKDPVQQARNFSFQSNIFEFGAGIEFNYLNYKLGHPKYFYTPYMFIEAAVFTMNPKTSYNNELVALQPIGTEGQNSNLTSKKSYSLIQFSIPMGIGFKINLGRRAAVSFEYGIRKTFTDYLDDVGDGEYIDKTILAEQNGNIAAALSDRSRQGSQFTGFRGNPSTKDWYSMFGVSFTFILGKAGNCFYEF